MRGGYIGLGAMGSALARQLVGKNDLQVWDTNVEATVPFTQLGVKVDVERGHGKKC
jgi:3-hydroxyisobutyrate dehydrogenase-like beta-hydroxyacid dehydrogenase